MVMKKTQHITTVLEYTSIEELDSINQELIIKAKEATQSSYSPYSKFRVGAAILLENGEIIQGSNQENSAYPSGLCAERVAMFYANSKFPDVAVKSIAIACYNNGQFLDRPIPPCGSCRQVLLETEERHNTPMKVFLYGQKNIFEIENIKQLLPLYFEKDMLDE